MTTALRIHKLLLFSVVLFVSAARIDAQAAPAKASLASNTAPPAMMIPLTTNSATAKEHFMLGLRAADVGQGTEARAHFLEAVSADPSFALAHLYTAFNANSTAEFRAHLEQAASLASKASPAERLMIEITQRGFANDPAGQLVLAQQLVSAAPNNPRALMRLAGIQTALGRPAAARATLEKAIKAAPRFAPAYIQLGNSYLTVEPRDPAKGATYIRRALNIEPNAAYTHDFMGDAYRANNDLVKARAEYTRQAELDPTHAIAFQQRGHVNSFLGKYAEARADYDKSISLGAPSEKVSFPVYRALVNVYAGDPKAAEQELEALVTTIDGMADLDGKAGAKIFALTTELSIALHNGHIDVAERAADQLRKLWNEEAEAGGSPEFRRTQQANIIYTDGMIAARKGDFAGARAKAQEFMKLVEPDKNPRKNEPAHEILGMADLLEKKYASAATHLAEGDPNSTYITYQRAVALEGAGKTAEARVLYRRVASTNFNSVDVALTKKDATAKAK
jgi:tetratricopeptide (TPR) repeat protein